jgi:hypothetical protein
MELRIDLDDAWIEEMEDYLGGDEKRILEVACGLLSFVVHEDKRGRVILSATTDGNEVSRVCDFYMRTKDTFPRKIDA